MEAAHLKPRLEAIYRDYNRREFVSPDPLQFLYGYPRLEDREIAALLASSLAYGRVSMILRNLKRLFEPMGDSPRQFVEQGNEAHWQELYASFRHRFTDGNDVAALLAGVRTVTDRYGTLGAALAQFREARGSLTGALDGLILTLGRGRKNSLLCRPSDGSACKRHFLMLRWMVRSDAVDPGGWSALSPSELIVPLDTHMYHISAALGLTGRKSADLKTATEITKAFAEICPEDPVRYDFALTRFGIREELTEQQLVEHLKRPYTQGGF